MRGGINDVQLLCDFTVSQGIIKLQAECGDDPGSTDVRRASVHSSAHVRDSVQGRKPGQNKRRSG